MGPVEQAKRNGDQSDVIFTKREVLVTMTTLQLLGACIFFVGLASGTELGDLRSAAKLHECEAWSATAHKNIEGVSNRRFSEGYSEGWCHGWFDHKPGRSLQDCDRIPFQCSDHPEFKGETYRGEPQ